MKRTLPPAKGLLSTVAFPLTGTPPLEQPTAIVRRNARAEVVRVWGRTCRTERTTGALLNCRGSAARAGRLTREDPLDGLNVWWKYSEPQLSRREEGGRVLLPSPPSKP